VSGDGKCRSPPLGNLTALPKSLLMGYFDAWEEGNKEGREGKRKKKGAKENIL